MIPSTPQGYSYPDPPPVPYFIRRAIARRTCAARAEVHQPAERHDLDVPEQRPSSPSSLHQQQQPVSEEFTEQADRTTAENAIPVGPSRDELLMKLEALKAEKRNIFNSLKEAAKAR
ncbi:hypothetical protein HKX48_005966 [Thoreauomyces humboldtii]|nr:hypothetical protein HKX48_005966 [Thoreauomyces humboldtii]